MVRVRVRVRLSRLELNKVGWGAGIITLNDQSRLMEAHLGLRSGLEIDCDQRSSGDNRSEIVIGLGLGSAGTTSSGMGSFTGYL